MLKKIILRSLKRKTIKRTLEFSPYFRELQFFDEKAEVIVHPRHEIVRHRTRLVQEKLKKRGFDLNLWPKLFIIDGDINLDTSVQKTLVKIAKQMERHDRLSVVLYNLYALYFNRLLNPKKKYSLIGRYDFEDMLKIAGLEIVRKHKVKFLGISLIWSCYLRKKVKDEKEEKVSVIVPARNEEGNISRIFEEFPDKLKDKTELVFVEGNSSDKTFEVIEGLIPSFQKDYRYPIVLHKQSGKGKGNAVEEAIKISSGNLVTILDADLTVPAKSLVGFYNLYHGGHADFVNGSRLIYPIEGNEMKTLNKMGNIFFSRALSYVLSLRMSDTLCGTKLFRRIDYERFLAWKSEFGEFDPFGDFDLLFPAAQLNIGLANMPLHYRERTYGDTNISRFRDGAKLFFMLIQGFFRVRY
jgi:hypothetical protein